MAGCKLHNMKYNKGYRIKVKKTGRPVTVEGKLHKDNYVWPFNYYIQSESKTEVSQATQCP